MYYLYLLKENFMFRILSLFLLVAIIFPAFSQQIIRPTGATNGSLPVQLSSASQANILAEPFEGQGYQTSNDMGAVDGNPFLYSEWKSGEVILKNGEKYKIEKMNLDASRDQFVYSKNDTLFEFSDNIREIKIYGEDHKNDPGPDMIFRSDINPLAANFVQVLTKGKVTIFCEYSKKPEGENYSNGIVNNTRKYVLHSNYYSLVNNNAIPVKFSSSTLDDLTSDKKNQVNTFIKENNLKVKKENDFLRVIIFYNAISTSAS